jgi:hypothetical protein
VLILSVCIERRAGGKGRRRAVRGDILDLVFEFL